MLMQLHPVVAIVNFFSRVHYLVSFAVIIFITLQQALLYCSDLAFLVLVELAFPIYFQC